ncbi:MAG: response regulator [Chloroflexi bacterium]|jgi:YesN/AraC family two-component response regulator|nr:response regulator [Chloroflexota bacterium]MBT7081435.1 response regulator [Chloroflexota bacterium]MBT7289840.1 response regulator [Chloroflexota bacterium]
MDSRINVLVVDDEPGMLETMADILAATGYRSSVVEQAKMALDLVGKIHFDIVLMDIVMPEMNGVDAYKKIRSASPDTKIIMMTGYGSDHPLVKKALGCGVEYLLHKPFDVDTLISSINQACGDS